jgi:hypothetical protein
VVNKSNRAMNDSALDRSLGWSGGAAAALASVLAGVLANDAPCPKTKDKQHCDDSDCPRHMYLTYWTVALVSAGMPLVRVLLNAGTRKARSAARVLSLSIALLAGTVLTMRLIVLGAPRSSRPTHWVLDITTHLLVPVVGVAQWFSQDVDAPSSAEVQGAVVGVFVTLAAWAVVAADRWSRTGAFVYRAVAGDTPRVLAALSVATLVSFAIALGGVLWGKRWVTHFRSDRTRSKQ